jgi:hypothetical protein
MSTLDASMLRSLQPRPVFGHVLGDILPEGVCFAAASALAANRVEALVVTLAAVLVDNLRDEFFGTVECCALTCCDRVRAIILKNVVSGIVVRIFHTQDQARNR